MAKNKYQMIKEIKEQSQVTKKIIAKHISGGKVVLNEFKNTVSSLENIERFIFLGCGTSYHAALFGNLVFEEITKLNCETEFADEFNKRNPVIEPDTAVIILSQSGETKEAIKAVKNARVKKAFVISITNDRRSKLGKLANTNLDLCAGKEVAVPATKTFTSQLLVLVLLAMFIKQIRGGKSIKIINDIKKLPELIKAVLSQEETIKKLALQFKSQKEIIVLGEKYNFPIALEGALKLKEAASVFAEGMATEEFAHGPKALSDIINLIKIGKRSLVINNKKISVPATLETLLPILLIIPLQLFAFHIALLKGINVDQPRNIRKFVK